MKRGTKVIVLHVQMLFVKQQQKNNQPMNVTDLFFYLMMKNYKKNTFMNIIILTIYLLKKVKLNYLNQKRLLILTLKV
ncbi:hypothetical protein CoNPh29_CDS0017 [Staphylococcus phage S-CoN_Ph29]|nr:hypothetical protein CoNPh29_CDS0017 [Staphylococcus phage S-CoN_Ph29]